MEQLRKTIRGKHQVFSPKGKALLSDSPCPTWWGKAFDTIHSALSVASGSHDYYDYVTDWEMDLKRLLNVLKPMQLVNAGVSIRIQVHGQALLCSLELIWDETLLCRATNNGQVFQIFWHPVRPFV